MSKYPDLPLEELVRQLIKNHGARWLGIRQLQLPYRKPRYSSLTYYVDGVSHTTSENQNEHP